MGPLLLLALAQTVPGMPALEEVPRVRPNVLLIVADDLGVEHVDWHPVGRTANNPAPTPFLSSMASRALVFTEAYGAPACSPARGSLLTGRYAFRTGLGGNIHVGTPGLPFSEITLAEELGAAGYATALFGKWHLSPERDDPNLQGFAHFDGSIFNLGFGGSNGYYDWTRVVNGIGFQESGYATTVVTDSAIAWIQQRDASKDPWFCHVAYHAPHKPYEPPPPSLNPITNAQAGQPDVTIYHGMIEALDIEVARLVSFVDTRDTLVIFVGDNGSWKAVAQPPVLPSKSKLTGYQGGILIPAMVWGATVTRVGEHAGPLHLVDLHGTLLDAARAPRAGVKTDSISMLDPIAPPVLRWVPQRESVFTELFEPIGAPPFGPHTLLHRALVGPRYKLLRRETGDELYDLLTDPWESVDLLQGILSPGEQQALFQLDAEMNAILGS